MYIQMHTRISSLYTCRVRKLGRENLRLIEKKKKENLILEGKEYIYQIKGRENLFLPV